MAAAWSPGRRACAARTASALCARATWCVSGGSRGRPPADRAWNRADARRANAPFDTIEYPDSGKIMLCPSGQVFRAADAVGYWDGE